MRTTAMTGEDLCVAFEDVPAAWRTRLTGWTPQAIERVIEGIRVASGGRPIAPADPWRALRLVAPEQARVVILGQDPYPTAGHADGLAFSSAVGRPPSLRRILAVLAQNRPGFVPPGHSRLDAWANQGVLLLNTVLTVEVGRIGSHLACGWQVLTADIVRVLLRRPDPPVFMLWGARAKAFFDEALAGLDSPLLEGLQVMTTRHPSNDFHREFMSDASHFLATAHRVDWWRLDDPPPSP